MPGSSELPERPREVFADACESIGAALATRGFRYYQSGPKLVRTISGFRQELQFWSSSKNEAGVYVELTAAFDCTSRKLAKWVEALDHDFWTTPGSVAFGSLGTLLPNERWLSWNLAPPESRAATIDEIQGHVLELLVPTFDLFVDPTDLFNKVSEAPVPGVSDRASILFALFLGRTEDAARIARRMVGVSPDRRAAVLRLIESQASLTSLKAHRELGIAAALPLHFDTPLDLP